MPSSDHCCIDIVVPSGDKYCFDTVAPSADHCIIEIVPPSCDHYCIETVAPSVHQCIIETVPQSSDHCRTDTVVASREHYCIETVAPSGDNCIIETVPPSSDHYCIGKVVPSGDHYCIEKSKPLPAHTSLDTLCSSFSKFFTDKITLIRSNFVTNDRSHNFHEPPYVENIINQFTPTTTSEVRSIILKSTNASCDLDPFPTRLLKHYIDDLIVPITAIINLSMQDGLFHMLLNKLL